jgi:hypothetical protein
MSAYYSTKDLCERFRCSSRTLFRRMKRIVNPFPAPCMKHAGSCNLWDASDIFEWEQRERERTRAKPEIQVLQPVNCTELPTRLHSS